MVRLVIYIYTYNIKLSSSEAAASHSKFSKIMVAIDGSEHSLKAAEYALEVAKFFNAHLFAVTILLSFSGRGPNIMSNMVHKPLAYTKWKRFMNHLSTRFKLVYLT
jgi:hypothetical protein